MHLVQHPWVDAVSAVFHTFKAVNYVKAAEVHVDIVCTFNGKPVWIIVSDRNPRYLHWFLEQDGIMSWRTRVEHLFSVAHSLTALQPASLLFCFAKGVSNSFATGFIEEGGASRLNIYEEDKLMPSIDLGEIMFDSDDEDWVCIGARKKPIDVNATRFDSWDTFKIDVNTSIDGFEVLDKELLGHLSLQKLKLKDNDIEVHGEMEDNGCSEEFRSLLSTLSQNYILLDGHRSIPSLVNLDTTALIALVSEISNGGAPMLVNMHFEDLVSKFKSTAQFMKDQVKFPTSMFSRYTHCLFILWWLFV